MKLELSKVFAASGLAAIGVAALLIATPAPYVSILCGIFILFVILL